MDINENIKKTLPYLMYGENSLVKLFDLQAIAVEKLNANKCVFVFDETGAGKTITAGNCILDTLILKKKINPNILIVCPQTLTSNWYNKIIEKFGIEFKIWGGKKDDMKRFDKSESNMIITSYSGNNQKEGSNKGLDVLIEKLKEIEFKWHLIILDESHNTKASTTHNNLQHLRSEKILLLSATPITNKVDELNQQIALSNVITEKNGQKIVNSQSLINNPLELIEAPSVKSPFMRNFKEIISNKNPKIRVIEPIKYKVDSIDADEFLKKYPYHDFSYFQNCCNINLALGEKQARDNKLNGFLNKIEDIINKDKSKAIVFCRRKNTVEYLRQNIVKNHPNIKIKAITSETFSSTDERKKFISLANNRKTDNSEFKILITIDTLLSEGYDMVTFDTIINYELPFTPAQIEQRLGRIDRILGSCHDEIAMFNFKNENYIEEFDCSYKNILEYKNQTQVLTCIPSKSLMTIEEIKNIIITNKIKYLGFTYLRKKVEINLDFSNTIEEINTHIEFITQNIFGENFKEELKEGVKKILKLSIEAKYSFIEQLMSNSLIDIGEFIDVSKEQLKNLCAISEEITIDNIKDLVNKKLENLIKTNVSAEMSNNVIWIDTKIGLTFKSLADIKTDIDKKTVNYQYDKPISEFISIGNMSLSNINRLLKDFDEKFDDKLDSLDCVIEYIWSKVKGYNYSLISSIIYSLWKRSYSTKLSYKDFVKIVNEVICDGK